MGPYYIGDERPLGQHPADYDRKKQSRNVFLDVNVVSKFSVPDRWIVLVAIVSCYLALSNLAHTHFWDDEAEVGIIARNLLASGKFTGWDGRNLLAYRNGSALDEHLRPINPPLFYPLTAVSFALFGQSTWAGRFPHAILGLMTLGIFLLLLWADFPGDKVFQAYCFVLLALSTVFLLNIRNCRYYSLCLFFSILTYYFYRYFIITKKPKFLVGLVSSALLFFFSHYMLAAAFLLSLGALHLVFHRHDFSHREWFLVLAAIAFFLFLTVPYIVYYKVWCRPDFETHQFWIIRRLKLIWWNLRELNGLGALPWMVVVWFAYLVFHRRSRLQHLPKLCAWAILGLGNALSIALLSPQPTEIETIADVRFLIVSVPFLVVFAGSILVSIHRFNPFLAVGLLGIHLACNVFSLTPDNRSFRFLLPAFIKEINSPYPTANGGAVEFLETNTLHDDIVYAYPDYFNYPLMFYVGDHCRFGCLLNRRTSLPQQTLETLGAPLLIEENFPDWVLSFGTYKTVNTIIELFSRPHEESGKTVKYHYELFQVLDVYWDETQRPELMWHSFGPKIDFNRRRDAVYVFKRLDDKPSPVESKLVNILKKLAQQPNDPQVHNNLGCTYADMRQSERALYHWYKALELEPDYALPHRNLATFFEKQQGDQQKATYHRGEYHRLTVDSPR